ncbi:MAG: Gfo/Idh/MocA family oxidoreductase [Candidatus Latescibacteria bacterium]|jgi:predicted dehydrogenase|nr:Gfo/Idh/MocA family oxidoreductase [Candidatus Latescibacterota bacterium]
MEKVNIGVLSHAHGHINTYCQEMMHFEDVDLIATWDDNEERGRTNAQKFGLDFCTTPEEVVNNDHIDTVLIGVETNRHADFVELAAEAGKNILLQKPMATTLADCDRITKIINETGVKFSLAFQMRQDPVNRKIKELVEQNVLGKIAVVRRRHCIPVLLNPTFVNGPSKWHIDPVANIGMFFDDATHAADWFYWIFGKPVSVMAEIDNIVTDIAPDDNGVALYRFENGLIGTLFNGSTTLFGVNTTEIYGDNGTLIQDFGDSPSTSAPRQEGAIPLKYIQKGDESWTDFAMDIPNAQGERIAAIPRPFVNYIRSLTEERVSPEEGRVSVEMVLAAYESAKTGKRVKI